MLLADGRLSAHRKPTVLRLYRPRVEPDRAPPLRPRDRGPARVLALRRRRDRGPGRERADAPHGCPRSEAVDDTVAPARARLAAPSSTCSPPLASDVDFEIDMVFSWVDGSSDEFVRERAKRMQSYVVGEGDDSEARYRQIDELKYALRVGATCSRRGCAASSSRPTRPRRRGSREHPRGHDRAQRGDVRRPVGAADPQLARRREPAAPHPGHRRALPLLERRHVLRPPARARRCSSRPAASRSSSRRRPASASARRTPSRSGFENAARVNRALLRERFGKVTTRHLEHCAAPLRRACMADLEAAFPEEFRAHRGEPVPFGHRHLGHELALPLLRAAHRPRGGADRRAGQVRRDHAAARRCPR